MNRKGSVAVFSCFRVWPLQRTGYCDTLLEIDCNIVKLLSSNAHLPESNSSNFSNSLHYFFNTPYVREIFRQGLSIDKAILNNIHIREGWAMRKSFALTLLFPLSTAIFAKDNSKTSGDMCVASNWISTQQHLTPQTCSGLPDAFASNDHLMGHAAPFQLTGSSIAIARSTIETNTVNTILHTSIAGYSHGTGTSWANAQLPSGSGSVHTGGYTQITSDVTTNLFHLGYTTTIRTNSTNTVNEANWATAVNTGPGIATATVSGASVSTASTQTLTGTFNTSESGTAANTGTATAMVTGSGTASAQHTSWSTTVTSSTLVFMNNSPTSISSSVMGASGSTSKAIAVSAGTGRGMAQASSTSSVSGVTSAQVNGNTTVGTTSGTSSASSAGTAGGGIITVIASSQQAASNSSNASFSNMANSNGGGAG